MPNAPTPDKLVPLDEDARKKLSQRIQAALATAVMSREELHPRWERNEEFLHDCPKKATQWNGIDLPMQHFPLVSPRVNSLRGSVLKTIFAQDPVVRPDITGGTDETELGEAIMAYFLSYAKVEAKMRKVAPISAATNNGVLRLLWNARKACPHVEVTHPRNFVMHDPNVHDLTNCQFAGFKYNRSAPEVKALKDAGEFYEGVRLTATGAKLSDSREGEGQRVSDSSASHPADKAVEFYELFAVLNLKDIEGKPLDDIGGAKEEGEYRPYLVVFATESQEVCSVKQYSLESAPFAVFRFMTEEDGNWWSSFSVCQSLQGLQDGYNHDWNLLSFGSYWGAFPPSSKAATLAGKKNQRLGIGEQSEHLPGNPPVTLQNSFEPAAIVAMIPMRERLADEVTGSSAANRGVQFTQDHTLGEVQEVQDGASTRESDYIEAFGEGLERLCSLMAEMLVVTFQEWAPVHGPKIPGFQGNEGMALAVLRKATEWEVQAKSASQSPQAMVQKMQLLLGLMEKVGPQPEQVAQVVAQVVTGLFQQMGVDISQAQAVGQKIAEQVMGQVQSPLDQMEIIKALVNNLELTNAKQILKEDKQDAAGTPGAPGANPLQAFMQLLQGAPGAGPGAPTAGLQPNPGMGGPPDGGLQGAA